MALLSRNTGHSPLPWIEVSEQRKEHGCAQNGNQQSDDISNWAQVQHAAQGWRLQNRSGVKPQPGSASAAGQRGAQPFFGRGCRFCRQLRAGAASAAGAGFFAGFARRCGLQPPMLAVRLDRRWGRSFGEQRVLPPLPAAQGGPEPAVWRVQQAQQEFLPPGRVLPGVLLRWFLVPLRGFATGLAGVAAGALGFGATRLGRGFSAARLAGRLWRLLWAPDRRLQGCRSFGAQRTLGGST